MNEALITVENLASFLASEISRLAKDKNLSDEDYTRIKDASIDATNLYVKLTQARGFLSK